MKSVLFVDDERPVLDGLRARLHEFDVLAAVVSAHTLVPSDDAMVFGADVPPDPKIGASYLLGVNAPFDWNEAGRRVSARAFAEVAM
jgi:hypothetical protein